MTNFDFDFFSILADFDQFRPKMAYFYKTVKTATNELQSWKLASECKKIFEKSYKRRDFDFFNFLIFVGPNLIF